MSGFGNSGLGSTPFGVGTPATATEPPDGPIGCRYLNPQTRDYETGGEGGQLKQMPPLRQRVVITMLTQVGSSTVLRDLGIKLPRKMDSFFESTVRDSVFVAFRYETEVSREMRIDEVFVERQPGGRAMVNLRYTDLTTGEDAEVSQAI